MAKPTRRLSQESEASHTSLSRLRGARPRRKNACHIQTSPLRTGKPSTSDSGHLREITNSGQPSYSCTYCSYSLSLTLFRLTVVLCVMNKPRSIVSGGQEVRRRQAAPSCSFGRLLLIERADLHVTQTLNQGSAFSVIPMTMATIRRIEFGYNDICRVILTEPCRVATSVASEVRPVSQ